MLVKRLRSMHDFFDVSPPRRVLITLAHKCNVVVGGARLSDTHPLVGNDFYRDEQHTTQEQATAAIRAATDL